MRLSLVPLLAPLLGAPLAAQLEEPAVREAFEEARAAVAESLGRTLPPEIPLTFTTATELADAVSEENLPLVRLRQPDPAKASVEARQLGQLYASFAYAKYSWSQQELLVVLDSWNAQVRRLEQPELAGAATVRAVLVHEIVHALDDAEHDMDACILRCTTTDLTLGMNAVIEGHAQHLARKVCAQRGWSEGFETFTGQIGVVPEGMDEATRLFLGAQAATLASAYHDGERFIAALEAKGGSELVARAFREPPDAESILRPEWFIDPASRPRTRYDLEPALERFLQAFPAESWSGTRLSLTPVQIAAGLALLPAESVQRIQATLRAARALSLQPTASPGSKAVVVALIEFDSEAAAKAYLSAARELGRIKDERMKSGQTRIVSSTYTELEDGRGLLAEKRMKSGPLEFDVISLDLVQGLLVLETVLSAETMERDTHLALAKACLAAVRER